MKLLSFLKVPEAGDKGAEFCPSISNNFVILNDHCHDNLTSKPIKAMSIAKESVDLLAANWIACGVGEFKQLVTRESGHLFDTTFFKFISTSGDTLGIEIPIEVKKISPTSFEVYTSFSDLDLKLVLS